MPALAQREQQVAAFQVMHILGAAHALTAQGHDVIHLEVGEPDFPTPERVVAAAQTALSEGRTFYTPSTGIPDLQTALAASYQRRYGVHIAPERFILTPGASGALQVVLSLTLDANQTLLLPEPGYPCNRQIAALLNINTHCAPLPAHTGFSLTTDWLAEHWAADTRALLVASPANPTGKVLARNELDALHQWCATRDAHLIVDEIYQGLDYSGSRSHSILELSDDAWVINSFSKYYGMTGWRLGWCVVPEHAVDAANRLCQNLFLAPPTVSQYAALRALQPDMDAEYQERVAAFAERRDCLRAGLAELGFGLPNDGQGAFYLYADIRHTGLDALTFCERLLAEQYVAVTPGDDFGGENPSHFVRFAYTCEPERLRAALGRIAQFVSGL